MIPTLMKLASGWHRGALIALASLAVGSPALAGDPTAWTSGGLPVAVAEGDQTSPTLVSDGLGGAIIAWSDYRPGVLYGACVQHLNSLGMPAPGWSEPGILLNGANDLSMSTDGARGAMMAWAISAVINYRRIVNGEPFAAEPAPAAFLETVASTAAGAARGPALPAEALKAPHNRLPFVLPDGAGGAILGWKRMALTGDKLMFQRLDMAGAAMTDWTYVRPSFQSEFDPSMCSDDSAGAIFAWKDGYPDGDIVARRVRSDGSLGPGLVVCGEPGSQGATGIVPDGAGGAIVVWRDGRNGSFEQIYAQRVTRDGAIAPGWPAGGRAICAYAVDPGDSRFNGTYYEASSPVVSDGAGGAFIVWSDRRADDGDVYCQHILPDGSLAAGWAENGVALCAAPGLQSRPAIAADGAGGVLACWEDARGGGADIYAQHVRGDGGLAPNWPATGLAVCVAPGDQRAPRLVSDGASGAIIAWQDARNGTADIYAARVTADAVVPALASLVSAAGRPGLARLVWYAGGPLGPRVTVERREATTDWVPIAEVNADGSGLIRFEDHDVIAGHRYGYRLAIVEGTVPGYRGEAWLDIVEAPGLALGAPYPNPSRGEVQIPFALPAGTGGAIELLDLSGRTIETRSLAGLGAGAHVARLAAGRPLPPGLYHVRLTHAAGTLTSRFAIVR